MNQNFPRTRLRRNRTNEWSRNLTAENRLSVHDLIYPIFIVEGSNLKIEINSMPGAYRYSLDQLKNISKEVYELGIPLIALFPCIDSHLKSNDGKEALNKNGLIPKAIEVVKNCCPKLGVMTDVALDPYTIHGQDGIVDNNGYVINDKTVEILSQQAILQASFGSDIVAPSDMMDGRVGAIRNILELNNNINTKIMAYTAKYASNFYGPFRDAVGSKINKTGFNKKNYQMNPANSNEALSEAELDISEGADMLLIKPGLPYLDIVYRIKQNLKMPTFAYQVSGEYSMIKAAAERNWLDERTCVLESLLCFKRAGCDGILSYFSKEAAKWLN
jgi:porphobilinogen synthase